MSFWNRDFLGVNWRGGRGGDPILLIGFGGMGSDGIVGL